MSHSKRCLIPSGQKDQFKDTSSKVFRSAEELTGASPLPQVLRPGVAGLSSGRGMHSATAFGLGE